MKYGLLERWLHWLQCTENVKNSTTMKWHNTFSDNPSLLSMFRQAAVASTTTITRISKTSCRRMAPQYAPPRPATEAHSGSLEPGRPSQARSANMHHPAGRSHTPPTDRMYATDVRQTDVRQHHRLMPPGWEHNKLRFTQNVVCYFTSNSIKHKPIMIVVYCWAKLWDVIFLC